MLWRAFYRDRGITELEVLSNTRLCSKLNSWVRLPKRLALKNTALVKMYYLGDKSSLYCIVVMCAHGKVHHSHVMIQK